MLVSFGGLAAQQEVKNRRMTSGCGWWPAAACALITPDAVDATRGGGKGAYSVFLLQTDKRLHGDMEHGERRVSHCNPVHSGPVVDAQIRLPHVEWSGDWRTGEKMMCARALSGVKWSISTGHHHFSW